MRAPSEERRHVSENLPGLPAAETNAEPLLIRREVYNTLEIARDDDDARLMEWLLVSLDPEDWEDPSNYPE